MANPLDQVAAWPATAAVGVASAAGLLESAGPAERPYRWASVTKLLVALAALDAVQRGLLDLDEPAGPPGSTIRHLLSHASGLGLDGDAILSPPGRRRIYSNRGIEIVADIIAARSGQPFQRLLADEICLPLGMAGTRLEGSPAWGAVGPLRDLMTVAIELVSPELVREDLLAEATQTAFPGLPGVLPGFGRQPLCDWGLGFEIRDSKEPHWTGSANSARTFGHFGRSGSFIWVDPEARIACASLADRDFGDWAKQAWPRLSDDVLASYAGDDLSGRTDHGASQQPGSCQVTAHARSRAGLAGSRVEFPGGFPRHRTAGAEIGDIVLGGGLGSCCGLNISTACQKPTIRAGSVRKNYLRSRGELRSRSGEPFQLCLARSLSSHLRGVKRDPPHPYHQGR